MLCVAVMANGQEADTMRAEMERFLAGMPTDAQMNQAKAIHAAIDGNFTALSEVRTSRKPLIVLPPGVDTLRVRDDILLFRPKKQTDDPLPLLIYLHGGGWTFGSINSCSRFCSAVASSAIAVAAVDYPLAPDHSADYIMDSVDDAVKFIKDHAHEWGASPDAVSLGGDSSGGNLALSAALRMPGMLRSLVIFYPVTDARTEATDNSPYAEGYGNDAILMEAFRDSYLGRERTGQSSPYISPILATDEQLAGLPPLLLITAECDILNRQGARFAERASALGGNVDHHNLTGTTHLFITVPGQTTAFSKSVELTTAFLKRLH